MLLQWWPHRLIPMRDAHTFAEPAMPGGSSSFCVFWSLSTKSKEFSHVSGCREPLAVPVAGGGPAQEPQHQCECELWAGLQSQCLQRSPGAVAQRVPNNALSLARAGEPHGLPATKPPTGVLWRVEEAFAMYLSPKHRSKRGRRERPLQHAELGAGKMQVPTQKGEG